MRIAAVLGAALGLAGCNMVTSTTPMFADKDIRGQAQPRAGVWMSEHQTCDFDAGAPIDTWPKCADGWIVAPGAVIGPREQGAPRAAWVSNPTVFAAGDPPVMQIHIAGATEPIPPYLYAGIRPLKLDAEGRIVEFKSWPALCGPPPPPDPNSKEIGGLTKEPIEGMTLDQSHQSCIATTPDLVRLSVRKSEAWSGDGDRSRWVRDGDR